MSLNLKSFIKNFYSLWLEHIANEYAETLKELCDWHVKVTLQANNDMMKMQNNSEWAQLRKIKQVYMYIQKQIRLLLFASAFVSFSK